MKTRYFVAAVAGALLTLSSCVKDLDTTPLNPWDVTSESAYGADELGYIQGLAKIYNTMSTHELTDISGVDGGATSITRAFWACQEITTDACLCAWGNDGWVRAMNYNTWTDAENEAVFGVFFRSLQAIAYVNEYIRQTEDDKLSSRGVSDEVKANIQAYRAEARLIRAWYYWMAMDVFGAVPFATENTAFGAEAPAQQPREYIYNYVVNELEELVTDASALPAARANYPRVDKGSALGLLARIYLNAEVYAGEAKWKEAKQTCEKIFNLGYSLAPTYAELFRGDNGENPDALNELLMVVPFDSHQQESYGGTSFLVHASQNQDVDHTETFINEKGEEAKVFPLGANGAWGGIRTTVEFAQKFFNVSNPNYETGEYTCADKRGIFHIKGRYEKITCHDEVINFLYGWSCWKYSNVPHDQTAEEFSATAANESFVDIDYPVVRLGEIYLIYAEACVRLNEGSVAQSKMDELAVRTGVPAIQLPASWDNAARDLFVAERARELMWEAHRRTDLIRYGLFSSAEYLWPFKGGESPVGQAFPEYKELFAIPASQIAANPDLKNPLGY